MVTSARDASLSQQRYVWNEELNGLEDRQTGLFYAADDTVGSFIANKGTGEQQTLDPGYQVNVGMENFRRFIESPALRGPLVSVFTWTILFAALSVLTTFSVGLMMALVLNDPLIRGRKIIRSLLIIPYAIPGVISILVWKGMMNPNLACSPGASGSACPGSAIRPGPRSAS
jgi:ABC-type sugar transport system permease subunit